MATTTSTLSTTSAKATPRDLRLRLGLTQEQLARELRVSVRTVSRWECKIMRMHPVYRERLVRMWEGRVR